MQISISLGRRTLRAEFELGRLARLHARRIYDARITDLDAVRADLEELLDLAGLDAAQALRMAIVQGRIDGITFEGLPETPTSRCVIGQLAYAQRQMTPFTFIALARHAEAEGQLGKPRIIESYVACITSGETPERQPRLRTLLGWIDAWLRTETTRALERVFQERERREEIGAEARERVGWHDPYLEVMAEVRP